MKPRAWASSAALVVGVVKTKNGGPTARSPCNDRERAGGVGPAHTGATATAGTPPAPCTSLTAAAATFTQTSPNTTEARDANNDNRGETLLTPRRAPASSHYPPTPAARGRPIVPDAADACMCLVGRVASTSAITANVNTMGRTRPTPPSGSLRMITTGTARLAQGRGCGRVRQQCGILRADRIHCKGADGVSGKR